MDCPSYAPDELTFISCFSQVADTADTKVSSNYNIGFLLTVFDLTNWCVDVIYLKTIFNLNHYFLMITIIISL